MMTLCNDMKSNKTRSLNILSLWLLWNIFITIWEIMTSRSTSQEAGLLLLLPLRLQMTMTMAMKMMMTMTMKMVMTMTMARMTTRHNNDQAFFVYTILVKDLGRAILSVGTVMTPKSYGSMGRGPQCWTNMKEWDGSCCYLRADPMSQIISSFPVAKSGPPVAVANKISRVEVEDGLELFKK